jgi:predicted PurR-regulated permease PerM
MATQQRARPREVISKLELPAATIARVILTLAIIWLLTRLWSILLLIFIAMLVAAALYPPVKRLEGRGLKRSVAVGIVFVVLIAGIALMLGLIVPRLCQ